MWLFSNLASEQCPTLCISSIVSPLSPDDVVEVSPHEVGHHVHISEFIQRTLRGKHVQKTNNLKSEIIMKENKLGSTHIFMVHVFQHPQFSVGPLGVNG